MVVIVLDPPWLEGVDERHEHQCADHVFHQLVLAEAAVPTVMPDHKQLHAQVLPLMPVCQRSHRETATLQA